MEAKLTFLGTGGSMGVPIIGCSCEICSSSSPFNKRLRPSALLSIAGKTFLIDAGPDFRAQALGSGLRHLDGVLLTHSHFDHIGGIDDLRIFYLRQKHPLPCLLSKDTFEEIKFRCHYLLRAPEEGRSLPAQFDFCLLEEASGVVTFAGMRIRYFSYFQGGMRVTGYRLGNFAYVSDIRDYGQEVLDALRGVDMLVLSALRYVPSEVHLSLEEAIAFAREVGAKRTYLTHISHELDHEKVNKELPLDIRLGHDGLNFTFELNETL